MRHLHQGSARRVPAAGASYTPRTPGWMGDAPHKEQLHSLLEIHTLNRLEGEKKGGKIKK